MENITQRLNGWGEPLLASPLSDHRDYQATIRRFESGSAEVSTHCIQHMNRMSQSRRWMSHDPVKLGVKELTEEQLARKKEENVQRSLRETKKGVRYLCKQIGADHMVTFSYRENMIDLSCLKRNWKAFARLVHARYPDWKYVAVHEYQDRGALHLHVAVKGYQDIKYLRRCWYIALGSSPESIGDAAPGAVNVRGPSCRWGSKPMQWKTDKLSGYLTKYMSKTFAISEANAKRYWASKGVKPPEVVKYWLGSTNFSDAVGETYRLLVKESGQVDVMWCSDSWQAIWMSG